MMLGEERRYQSNHILILLLQNNLFPFFFSLFREELEGESKREELIPINKK